MHSSSTHEPARLFVVSTGLVLGAAVAGVLAASLTATPARAAGAEGGDFSAGVQVKKTAKASEIGLPVFPGAVPKPGEGDDHHGATVGAHWGSLFGFKVVVLKYTSPEPIDTVAGYYREALGQHGTVLDCSHGVPRAPAPRSSNSSQLRCNEDPPRPGELVYKVGTQGSQRVVSLRPSAGTGTGGVDFQLVRVDLRNP